MKKNCYDRTQALDAMYELQKQGFTDIQLTLDNKELMLRCNPSFASKIPEIEIDDVESWSNLCNGEETSHNHPDSSWHEGFNKDWEYWWIFD